MNIELQNFNSINPWKGRNATVIGDADRIAIEIGVGEDKRLIRISESKGNDPYFVQVSSPDGTLVIHPEVSNCIRLTVEKYEDLATALKARERAEKKQAGKKRK